MEKKKGGCLRGLLWIVAILALFAIRNHRNNGGNMPYVDRLPNLDSSYDDHSFLHARNYGNCQQLRGKVVITYVMLDLPDVKWSQADAGVYQMQAQQASRELEQQALEQGVDLQIHDRFISCTIDSNYDREDHETWVKEALRKMGYNKETAAGKVKKEFEADSAPFLFCINQKERSYARWNTNFEYAVLFGNQPDHRHELLHLYGAVDFYYPEEATALAQKLWPDSIMLSGTAEAPAVDELTAYLVGWTDTLSKDARYFVNQTKDVTMQQVSDSREEKSFTGTKTDRYGDTTYTGQWQNGVPYGQGEMEFESGAVYVGQFVYGRMEGYGTITWENGDQYAGAWENGKRTGYGTYTWSNGNCYEGQWLEGEMHGQGTMRYHNGRVRTGQWQNGEFIG